MSPFEVPNLIFILILLLLWRKLGQKHQLLLLSLTNTSTTIVVAVPLLKLFKKIGVLFLSILKRSFMCRLFLGETGVGINVFCRCDSSRSKRIITFNQSTLTFTPTESFLPHSPFSTLNQLLYRTLVQTPV